MVYEQIQTKAEEKAIALEQTVVGTKDTEVVNEAYRKANFLRGYAGDLTNPGFVIRRNWLENAKALIRQEHEPVMKCLADYKAGGDPEKWLEDLDLVVAVRRCGTRIQAVIKYIEDTYDQPKASAKTARKKTEADKEAKE